MTTDTIRKFNSIVGTALVAAANEAHEIRISKMLERPFDEVINAIKVYKETRYNKANGYFADEAIRYFDNKLEIEHEDVWMDIEDTCDTDWFKAIEIYRW